MHKDLNGWLTFIEHLHSRTIDLGLERMQTMLERLNIRFSSPVVLVGGTNGKGSTCAYLEAALMSAGYKVGVHTSPHLLRFNERMRLNGKEVSDEDLIRGFKAVEEARKDLSLSYFEYTLLAILVLFMEARPDALILEIGLGGRLDAVNTIEPAVSVITSIGIDHTAFLGNTRDEIGWDKAHIFRPGKPAVCADADPPARLIEYARTIGAKLLVKGEDFKVIHEEGARCWDFLGSSKEERGLPLPAMAGDYQLSNASAAFEALQMLSGKLKVSRKDFIYALEHARVIGRFSRSGTRPEIILDVGHNPHAAKELVKTLKEFSKTEKGRTLAVFGMLSDKDRRQVCQITASSFDEWFVADLPGPRGGKGEELREFLINAGVSSKGIHLCEGIPQALKMAQMSASEADKIVAFGSFLTVAAVEEIIHSESRLTR